MDGLWMGLEILLKGLGCLVALAGWFSIIREMWSESRLLGLLALWIPLAALFYAGVLHRDELGRPALVLVSGLILVAAGLGVEALRST